MSYLVYGVKVVRKYRWIYLLAFILLLSVSRVWAKPAQDSSSQWNLSQRVQTGQRSSPRASSSKQVAPTQKNPKPRPSAILESLFRQLVRSERPLGSRSNLCAITPGLLGKTDTIWHDHPLFSWKGSVEQVIVRSYDTGEVLWQQKVADQTQNLAYTGASLKPGQVYEWEMLSDSTTKARFTFMVMPAPDREQFMAELKNLEAQLQAEGASPSRIALARAELFAQQGLWSDTLQSLYSVTDQPVELQQTMEEISTYLCGKLG